VTMVFAGSAAVGAVALASYLGNSTINDPAVARALTAVGYGLVFVFAVRGGGMFALTTTTLLRGGGVLSRAWSVVAFLLAVFLLLTATSNPAAVLVFPLWVVLIAVALLAHDRRAGRATPDEPDEVGAAEPPVAVPAGAGPETTPAETADRREGHPR
jgi:hypothetical protein